MEVRIKDNNGYVDADWTIENGVMVVSPKVEKFEPKDGDVLSSFFNGKYQGIFVFEEASECGEAIFHFALDADGKFIKGNGCNYFGYVYNARPSTEKEKRKLFDNLKEEGLAWDAEKREIIKLKWKPNLEEKYWYPSANTPHFKPLCFMWTDSVFDSARFESGWCFRSEDECQAFCDKLNQTIEGFEP